jgi:hypothetical protein
VEVISCTLHACPARRMSPGARRRGEPLVSTGVGWVRWNRWVTLAAYHGHPFVGKPLEILTPDTRSIMQREIVINGVSQFLRALSESTLVGLAWPGRTWPWAVPGLSRDGPGLVTIVGPSRVVL